MKTRGGDKTRHRGFCARACRAFRGHALLGVALFCGLASGGGWWGAGRLKTDQPKLYNAMWDSHGLAYHKKYTFFSGHVVDYVVDYRAMSLIVW
jgi:hypothetical protein